MCAWAPACVCMCLCVHAVLSRCCVNDLYMYGLFLSLSADNGNYLTWSQGQDIPLTITTRADIELLPHRTTTSTGEQAKAFKEESDSDLSPDHIPRLHARRERKAVRRAMSALETSSSPMLSTFYPRQPFHMSMPQRFKPFHPNRWAGSLLHLSVVTCS